jgi:hypothetical protein
MINFKQYLDIAESHAELDKHISDFSKRINTEKGSQSSTYQTGHSTYKNGGGKIHNMKYVATDAPHEKIFKHLKSMGYKKMSGHDPKPNEFDVHHNHETMTSRTSPVHHPSGISAHVETEHGSRPKVHFTHNKITENLWL